VGRVSTGVARPLSVGVDPVPGVLGQKPYRCSRTALTVEAFGVGLRLIGYDIGVPFGVVGVAVELSATSIVYLPCRIMVLRSLTGLSLSKYARQFGSAVVATGLMIVALLLVRSVLSGDVDEQSLLTVEVLVALAAYGIPLLLLDRASVNELVGLVRSVVWSEESRRSRRGGSSRT
jgi:hypothetical protein